MKLKEAWIRILRFIVYCEQVIFTFSTDEGG